MLSSHQALGPRSLGTFNTVTRFLDTFITSSSRAALPRYFQHRATLPRYFQHRDTLPRYFHHPRMRTSTPSRITLHRLFQHRATLPRHFHRHGHHLTISRFPYIRNLVSCAALARHETHKNCSKSCYDGKIAGKGFCALGIGVAFLRSPQGLHVNYSNNFGGGRV